MCFRKICIKVFMPVIGLACDLYLLMYLWFNLNFLEIYLNPKEQFPEGESYTIDSPLREQKVTVFPAPGNVIRKCNQPSPGPQRHLHAYSHHEHLPGVQESWR